MSSELPSYEERYGQFPPGFFDRMDVDDDTFYGPPRLVTHIDDGAIGAVGELYTELGIDDRQSSVLDLMSSWISHFHSGPGELVALGMNPAELAANEQATSWVRHDLNTEPVLPFADEEFDAVVCCVSVDYLARPLEVFDEVWRVLRPGGVFVNTFSNRCFPTKIIQGWASTDDQGHVAIVGAYYQLSGPWQDLAAEARRQGAPGRDPLYAVWARRPTG